MEERRRKLLVLYSWEGNNNEAKQWALSFCYELNNYTQVEATCDMLWAPHSDTKQEISQEIQDADNILVIVSKSYNEKIRLRRGMVSFEEAIYEKLVNTSKETNKILFLQKDPGISLPKGWKDFCRIDVSSFNQNYYFQSTAKERQETIDQIIRFCFGLPEYCLINNGSKELPKPKNVEPFSERYCKDVLREIWRNENYMSIEEQERRLIEFITKNAFQKAFVDLYIRAGLSADLNLRGRITPQLFKKHFLVKREDEEEEKYNEIINELLNSTEHNCLCLQSDGGSGKSTFIQTMGLRKKNNSGEYFTNIILDLSNLSKYQNTKEDLLFQRVRKEYNRMSKSKGGYFIAWRNAFEKRIQELEKITFEDDRLFAVTDVQANLRSALSNLVPDKLDDWYKGYTSRITSAKNTDSTVLFIILIIIYLMILDCKPQLDRMEKFSLIFDNIETFDNGQEAQKISYYVEVCYRYAKNVFLELGIFDNFYEKFTLIVVLRTSTLIPFANMQTDMWSGDHFVKQIKYFDFTEEALLKKLKFLQKIPDYKNTILFKRVYAVVSVLLPTNKIDEYLKTGSLADAKYRHFTSKQILPLFNNDYRKTMKNLHGSIVNEDRDPTIYSMIMELSGLEGSTYDYYVNGIRMALIRDVFNRLKIHDYFEEIGFSDLSGVENYSMTRLVLDYLYWNELNSVVQGHTNYIGAELSEIASTFKYFCNHENLVDILYCLSIYTNKNSKKGEALHEWGNLLVFDNLNVDFTQSEFNEVIKDYLITGKAQVKIGDVEINLRKVYVRLSDAGMCFTQHYIRSFEFLMSRRKKGTSEPALFLMRKYDTLLESLNGIYDIIKNCISKLIMGCENICVLFGKEKEECAYRRAPKNEVNLNIMVCSLFIRYQECLDMVREAIDYIDRYRVITYRKFQDNDLNGLLLMQIKKYYELYGAIKDTIKKPPHDPELQKFLNIWEYPNNQKLNALISEKIKHSERITKVRPIQTYYTKSDENIQSAIDYAYNHPSDRIYDIIAKGLVQQEQINTQ